MRCPSLYWYRSEPNFGDAFSPMAVRYCLGCNVVPAGKWDCDIVAEGSVLDFVLLRDAPSLRGWLNRMMRRPLVVWGSGMLFPLDRAERQTIIRRTRFLAVRGEKTLDEMRRLGIIDTMSDIAFGDPGIFMPEVLGIVPKATVRRGLVLHACSWINGEAERFASEHPEIRLIDPRRAPDEVCRDIASCAEVFSSSLHGLIAADAFGIPNRWVALETPFADSAANRFKFDDYYSAFGETRLSCAISEAASALPFDPLDASLIEDARRHLRERLEEFGKEIRDV